MPTTLRALAIALCCAALAGCATPLTRTPTQLTAASAPPLAFRVQTDFIVAPDTGFRRPIKQGSVWKEAGRLSEGTVFKPTDTTLTIGDGNHYEAWLVVDGERITGFYLPGERSFAPLTKKVVIPWEPTK